MAHILIIDDESNIRLMVRLGLVAEGYTVETAADGPEGLDKFGDGHTFDLCLLDQRMPGLTGLEVLREMRRRAPGANVIMITAFGTIDLAETALRAGASDFVRKPFTLDVLRNAVKTSLSGDAVRPSAQGTTAQTRLQSDAVPSFDFAAINGFRIVSETEVGRADDLSRGIERHFTVRDATGTAHTCSVTLPAYVVELVRAHANRESFEPEFWSHLCEEALANALWQNAELPANSHLPVDDLTSGMRRWMDAVLAS